MTEIQSQSEEMVKIAYKALSDKKGEEIRIIDINGVSTIADYFIVATGSNLNHVQALVDNVEEHLDRAGHPLEKRIEGTRGSSWILMDYKDVVIHIFSREDRLFYDLERIWRDGVVREADEFGIDASSNEMPIEK